MIGRPVGRPCQRGGEGYSVTELTVEELRALWRDRRTDLDWNCLFVLPPWLGAWLGTLGAGERPLLRAVWRAETLLGVAPLLCRGDTVRFLGSPDVCDYQDFVLAPGGRAGEKDAERFFQVLLFHLRESGVRRADLGPVRPDSAARRGLPAAAEREGWAVSWEPEGVSAERDLPPTWEAFLEGLGKRERHEVRRKLRRLEEAGGGRFRRAPTEPAGSAGEGAERFLGLLSGYRADKTAFLDPARRAFFRQLLAETAREGLLNLGFLDVEGETAAGVLCFDYRGTTYLYNNGYDPRWESLSVGILSKVWSIRDSIARGMRRYDFLKGDEEYKRRLGGRRVPLARCRLSLSGAEDPPARSGPEGGGAPR
ncbi:MAG: GNAT family N-acetyltransferase [Deferrisomatales bacterium]